MLAYLIYTPYDADFVHDLKEQTEYHRWQKDDKCWLVGKDDIDTVRHILNIYFDEDDVEIYPTDVAAYRTSTSSKRISEDELMEGDETEIDQSKIQVINADDLTSEIKLSEEQQFFIDCAKQGDNILVEACIGSGKTTAIQRLCDALGKNKRILYLTYNKLLKIDAKAKIKNKNVTVTNYHGFAYSMLMKKRISCATDELIQTFNQVHPKVPTYDVIVIDEYQDIDLEISELLTYVKESAPNAQLIAVGDMAQKIYDKTSLNVSEFIDQFLGSHKCLEFTQCFRLNAGLAAKLGRVWNKEIRGVNQNFEVMTMSPKTAVQYMSRLEPKDILCLGALTGTMPTTLNVLERKYPEKFNKNTVYAKISLSDSGSTSPTKDTAIFTTYDGSKGMERPWCFVFDFDDNYWDSRAEKAGQSYEVLRNLFCVAASRAKYKIVFVLNGEHQISEEKMASPFDPSKTYEGLMISTMFNFKYKEDIEAAYNLLTVKEIPQDDHTPIIVKNFDGLIDLSPCIGEYQEYAFFAGDSYNIDKEIALFAKKADFIVPTGQELADMSIEEKILTLTAAETKQNRYKNQVDLPFMQEDAKEAIIDRLGAVFSRHEDVQYPCDITFDFDGLSFQADGLIDVYRGDTLYELKFVNELSHEHFLQIACYMYATQAQKGILWNTRDNTMFEITISDRRSFMNAVTVAVTKGKHKVYVAGKTKAEKDAEAAKGAETASKKKPKKKTAAKSKKTGKWQKQTDSAQLDLQTDSLPTF